MTCRAARISAYLILAVSFTLVSTACNDASVDAKQQQADTLQKEKDYIRAIPGKNDTLSAEDIERGKVLIAYSDCYTCHAEDTRAKGPAFRDIAKRYPINKGYIELLAQRIVIGGSGAWGYPVMSAHPDLRPEDAKTMVKYILSLKQ